MTGLLDMSPQIPEGLLGPLPGIQNTQSLLLPNPTPGMARSGVAAPEAGPDNRSWLQKLQMGAGNALDSLLPSPPGMESLLSPENVKQSRSKGLLDFGLSMLANAHGQGGGNAPSLGQALAGGVQAGRAGYDEENQKQLTGKLQGMQIGQQQRMLAGRQLVGQFLTQAMQGTPEQQSDALSKAHAIAIAHGDFETAKALQGVVEKHLEVDHPKLEHVDMGDKIGVMNPRTGQILTQYEKGRLPPSPEVLEMMRQRADAARESMGLRADAAADREENRSFTRERALVAQHDQEAKPTIEAAGALNTLQALKKDALAGNPIAQQSALMAYIKAQHPNVSVKSGELHNFAGTMGLGEKAETYIKGLENGQRLSSAQMRTIYKQVDDLHRMHRARYAPLRRDFEARAARYGIDPRALSDPFRGLDDPGAQAPTGNPLMQP